MMPSATISLNWYVELDRSRIIEKEAEEEKEEKEEEEMENKAGGYASQSLIELSNCRSAVVM